MPCFGASDGVADGIAAAATQSVRAVHRVYLASVGVFEGNSRVVVNCCDHGNVR